MSYHQSLQQFELMSAVVSMAELEEQEMLVIEFAAVEMIAVAHSQLADYVGSWAAVAIDCSLEILSVVVVEVVQRHSSVVD